jgi:subtilisin family serine protease
MDGTSASAPIVSGAIAAIMSAFGLTAAQAVEVLTSHASEAGVEGADADYGSGIVNLGWAMARNDPARVDTAVAGQSYDPASGTLEVVVQNRSARAASALMLVVDAGGTRRQVPISWLAAGATQTLAVPVAAPAGGETVVRVQLVNPIGIVDAVPENNTRVERLVPVADEGAGP